MESFTPCIGMWLRRFKLIKCTGPSSNCCIGPNTPKINTPQLLCERSPITIYGISKAGWRALACELLFSKKYNVDVEEVFDIQD